MEQFKLKKLYTNSESSCLVCFNELGKNFATLFNCGHKFHKECIQYSIIAGIKSSAGCPQCSQPISVKDLKTVVPLDVINDLITKHLATYKMEKKNVYKNCLSKDCNQLYTVPMNGQKFVTCLSCRETYCLMDPEKPHKDHPTQSCAQYLLSVDAELLFNNMLKEGEIKQLRCCNSTAVKTEGCNHITCPLCQQHSCYLCLRVFKNADAVYAHQGDCLRRPG